MQQPIEFPKTDWLSLAEARDRALSLFRGKNPVEVERSLIIAFSEAAIPTRGRLTDRPEMLPPALWAGVQAISWVGSCFVTRHRSRWRNDVQEYRVSELQVRRRDLEAWLRRAVRASGRPSLAVVNSTVLAEGATDDALGDTPVKPDERVLTSVLDTGVSDKAQSPRLSLDEAIERAIEAKGLPARDIRWNAFCHEVRRLCGVKDDAYGYGDRTIKNRVGKRGKR